jgi:hypothetical protein
MGFIVKLNEKKGAFYFAESGAGTFSIPAELVEKTGCGLGDEVEIFLNNEDQVSKVTRRQRGVEGPITRAT